MTQHNYSDDFDFGVDLDTVEESNGYQPIPRGKYKIKAKEITHKPKSVPTATGFAQHVMAVITFELTDEYAGRLIFANYNVIHSNQQTANIARGHIKAWLKACGIALIPHQKLTLALMKTALNREFIGSVSIEKDKTGEYDDGNRINKFESLPQPQYQPQTQPQYTAPQPPQSQFSPAPVSPQYTAQNPPPGCYYHAETNQFYRYQ